MTTQTAESPAPIDLTDHGPNWCHIVLRSRPDRGLCGEPCDPENMTDDVLVGERTCPDCIRIALQRGIPF